MFLATKYKGPEGDFLPYCSAKIAGIISPVERRDRLRPDPVFTSRNHFFRHCLRGRIERNAKGGAEIFLR
jgi:hypothetical protein